MWVCRKTALEQEQANSRAYFHIMRLAKDEKDYVTEQLIQSYYIPEQVCARPF
jgi:ferritin